MTNKMSVSVVVPALNAGAIIGDMLNGLLSQIGAPEEREIIVVDNGSSDDTQTVVRKFGLTLLEQRKPGPAAAKNLGLSHAKGDIILNLDADSVPTSRWIANLVAPFADPKVILAGGRILDFQPETPAQRYFAACGFNSSNSVFRSEFPFVPGGNFAVRRKHALAIGGWSEDLLAGEDADFSHRILREFDTEIKYVPNAVLFHRARRSDEELRIQSWSWGQGWAILYSRYPEVLRWDLEKTIKLAWALTILTLIPTVMHTGQFLRLISSERVEFVYYHRFRTWWYWRGFLSALKTRRFSPPSKPSRILAFYPRSKKPGRDSASGGSTT